MKVEKCYMIFGFLVKKARLEKKWTVEDLSKKTKMPKSTIRGLENGCHRTSFSKIVLLSKILKIDLNSVVVV